MLNNKNIFIYGANIADWHLYNKVLFNIKVFIRSQKQKFRSLFTGQIIFPLKKGERTMNAATIKSKASIAIAVFDCLVNEFVETTIQAVKSSNNELANICNEVCNIPADDLEQFMTFDSDFIAELKGFFQEYLRETYTPY